MKFIAKNLIFCLGLTIFAFANDSENLKLENECENGNIDSCHELADKFYEICTTNENLVAGEKAIKYYDKVCEADKSYGSCWQIAYIYTIFESCVKKNLEIAKKYAKISCYDENERQACLLLAITSFEDEKYKKEHFQKACEHGYEQFCKELELLK